MVRCSWQKPRKRAKGLRNSSLQTHRTIELQNVVNVVLQVAVMLQQIGYGSIQIAATHLRTRHFLGVVDVGIAGESAYKLNEEFFRVVDMRQNNVGSDQGTGIDERIARLAVLVFQLYKRIESRADGSLPILVHSSLPKMLKAMASEKTLAILCMENFTSDSPRR